MPARKPTPPPKASGENIGEWQRKARLVQFRLTERETLALEAEARAKHMPANAYAQQVLRKHLDLPAELTPEQEREAYAADQRHDATTER